MVIRYLLLICLFVSLVACASDEPNREAISTQPVEQVVNTQVVLPAETLTPTEIPKETESVPAPTPTKHVEGNTPAGTSGPYCYSPEPNQIALGIVEEFESTTYEQVMNWFCNGAEFENILLALQTEKQTAYPAEELLLMIAGDMTWEEIWLDIGLIEE